MRVSIALSAIFAVVSAITSPPAGAATVGSGEQFSTVQAAVDSGASVIFIFPGTYNEQVFIQEGHAPLTIYGSSSSTSYTSNTVTIQAGASADQGLSDDETGTFRAHSDNLKMYNVNVVNTRGSGSQAIALSAYGDQLGFYGCAFKGFQDTVLTEQGHHVFAKSLIQGATDFIFGQTSLAWFESVDIRVLTSSVGYLTANGRDSATNPSWYVINNSNVAAASGNTVANGAYYLGRPWRDFSRVTFQNTALSAVINPAGWSIWSTATPNTDHVSYTEFDNSGAGASGTRASFSSKLSSAVSTTTILGSGYQSWVDGAYLQ